MQELHDYRLDPPEPSRWEDYRDLHTMEKDHLIDSAIFYLQQVQDRAADGDFYANDRIRALLDSAVEAIEKAHKHYNEASKFDSELDAEFDEYCL